MKEKIINQINEQFSAFLKNSSLQDIEKNFKAIVLSIFSKLELVTREEFDTQQRVLLETRKKLEELEKEIDKFKKE